jgi:predicted transcriptional regulator
LKYPCEVVAKYVLPSFRSLIAKELIEKHGFTQVAAANKLGTTQAAISYYFSSKRGEKYVKLLENKPLIKSMIQDVTDKLVTGAISSIEMREKLCAICSSIKTPESSTT